MLWSKELIEKDPAIPKSKPKSTYTLAEGELMVPEDINRDKYLLIISCSEKKKDLICVPALELYDGPSYKVVKKHNLNNLDILILSAKYGLIKASEKISYYDQKMTAKRAKEISGETKLRLERILYSNKYKQISINLGKTYILALADCRGCFEGNNIYWINGRIGERLHQLKEWLQLISI